jgi:hypothetical protein
MGAYSPLKVTGMATGLVKSREEFLLPDDAYPNLLNSYVWRERILRKKGYQLLGRLQRNIGTTDGAGDATITIVPSPLQTGISSFTVGTNLFNDPGTTANPGVQTLLTSGPGTATLNRVTGLLTITGSTPTTAVLYSPGLPVMGIRIRELANSANDQTVFFDQVYAYIFNQPSNSFVEFIPGTTWNKHGGLVSEVDFFWSTNYWIGAPLITNPPAYTTAFTTPNKLFWVTNNTGQFAVNADPPRITDGVTWLDFYHDTNPVVNSPWAQIDMDALTGNPNWLVNWLSMLPFRGRLVTFNTWEGISATSAKNYSNRIRWSTIGNPFIPYDAGPPATGSWRDDIRGQGGFLDIPTSEDIISIGFVRDNLVIYCERSTWQLRYTGRSIAPFQIEKVNSELGGEGPFSAVQFDTSLVGIGDKGVVECDSYKSERIDIKIPDFVFDIQSTNDGPFRVHGIRDFIGRLAYWTIPLNGEYDGQISPTARLFPNRRLVYNYENDSWALFTDSLTTIGNYQPQSGRTWLNTHVKWIDCKFSWIGAQAQGIPSIVGGNQQGFIEFLDQLTVNDPSLYISNIVGHGVAGTPITGSPTRITSPNHNLVSTLQSNIPYIIQISGIPIGTPYANLNGGIFGINVIDANNFDLYTYDPETQQFSSGQIDVPAGAYVGGGLINLRENFFIQSKKFNFLDEGQSIQLGYLDILMDSTAAANPGAISLNVYLDYNDDQSSNTLPQNELSDYGDVSVPDTFFNSIIPTTSSTLNTKGGTKFWQRVYCATRANFITLVYTFSNAQLNGTEQELDVQVDAQVLWIRRGGRMTDI